jgi:hypothetical protein
MGFDGTHYYTEGYRWALDDDVLGQASTPPSGGRADLTAVTGGLTQQSSNRVDWQ